MPSNYSTHKILGQYSGANIPCPDVLGDQKSVPKNSEIRA